MSISRIAVEKDTSDIAPLMGVQTAQSSFDPYFISTEFEKIQSQIVLDAVVQSCELREEWKDDNGGEPLSELVARKRLEKVIELQKEHTLIQNKKLIGSTQTILVEKESKMSENHWAGRTDSNKWVIFNKGNIKVNEFVKVVIKDTRGISLRGELPNEVIAA